VVFPFSTDDVSRIVKLAVKHDVPIVERAPALDSPACAGTWRRYDDRLGRMNRILELDLENSSRSGATRRR